MAFRGKKLLTIALILVCSALSFWAGRRGPNWFASMGQKAAPVIDQGEPVRFLFQGTTPSGPVALSLFRLRADRRYEAAREQTFPPSGPVEWRLPPGRYWLLGRAPGASRFSDAFEVRSSGRVLERIIELSPPSALTVEVRVRAPDDGLEALPGATVVVERAPHSEALAPMFVGAPFGGLTNAGGQARFSLLPPPPYRVRVFARGYEPYDAEVTADQLVVLRPVHVLRVRVKSRGQPVPGSIVELSGLMSWPVRRVETDAQGVVELLGLKAGRYAIFAEASELIGGPAMVELSSGVGIEEVTIDLSPGLSVTIRCKDQKGVPIQGAHVSFQPGSPYDVPRYGETDGDGSVRLGPLRREDGTVFVSAPGFVSRAVMVSDEREIDVELLRGGTVVGRVVDSTGMPISGATLRIYGTDEFGQAILHAEDPGCARDSHFSWALGQSSVLLPAGELGVMLGPVPAIPLIGRRDPGPCPTAASPRHDELITDKDGRFAAYGVAPGTIVALAEHEAYLTGRSAETALQSEGSATVSITLGEAEELIGRVLDFRDFPVEGAVVRVLGRGNVREVRTHIDGTFRVAVAHADLTLRVFPRERPLVAALEERVMKERAPGELTFRLPRPREATHIRVRDEEGHDIELAQVKLRSLEPSEPVTETRFTDARGEVEIKGVRGLEARLSVSSPSFAPLEITRSLGDELNLTLARGLRAEGRVTSVRGRAPAPSAQVRLACGSESFSTVSRETGEYVFPDARRGKCTLSAHHESLGSARIEVEIQKTEYGRAFALPDLDLLAPVEYSGRVEDARGEPVPGALVSAVPLPPYLPRESALLPEPLAIADERGEFTLGLSPGQTSRLYAVLPARASGASGNVRVEGSPEPVSIVLRDEAPAPLDLVATILVGLEEKSAGLVVSALLPRDPETKNLRVGDVLLEIDREKPRDLADARELLSGAVGSEVRLLVERSGRNLDVTARREAFRR